MSTIYNGVLSPACFNEDPEERLDHDLAWLKALTCLICGNGHETFQALNDTDQGSVLFLISELAADALAARCAATAAPPEHSVPKRGVA